MPPEVSTPEPWSGENPPERDNTFLGRRAFLDGVYALGKGQPRFRRVSPPGPVELELLLGRIIGRIARHLERRGLLVRDAENSYLSLAPGGDATLDTVLGHSITYRVAVGPNEGRKAFTLQSLALPLSAPPGDERLAKRDGFSLHAGVAAAAHQREKVERLCRYLARPALATARLALTAQGEVRYTLKTPYRDGTTHVVFEPLDFIARLAALVPKPRVHLTRYHGVFAPHSALRAQVTPAGRGRSIGAAERSPVERHRAMSWAQRLKRVFRIEIERCERCGGKVKILASIEDPLLIARILAHLGQGSSVALAAAHPPRASPAQGRLDLF